MAGGSYMIALEDGGGMEFFFTKEKKLVLFSAMGTAEPEWFQYKSADKQLGKYRPDYPVVCHLYILHRVDFNQRRTIIRAETQAAKKARDDHRA